MTKPEESQEVTLPIAPVEDRLLHAPIAITPQVIKFAQRLNHGTPVYVQVRPRKGAAIDERVAEVQRAVREEGGKTVAGWMILEWPTVLLEAEFHMVWETRARELVDVSPKPDGETRILFVADRTIPWRTTRIANRLMPLRKLPEISAYIQAEKRKFELTGTPRITPERTVAIAESERLRADAVAALRLRTPKDKVAKARAASRGGALQRDPVQPAGD